MDMQSYWFVFKTMEETIYGLNQIFCQILNDLFVSSDHKIIEDIGKLTILTIKHILCS